MIYEIRRNGVTLCSSSVTNAGYPLDTLRSTERCGLYLYCGGKRLRTASIKTQPHDHERKTYGIQ